MVTFVTIEPSYCKTNFINLLKGNSYREIFYPIKNHARSVTHLLLYFANQGQRAARPIKRTAITSGVSKPANTVSFDRAILSFHEATTLQV